MTEPYVRKPIRRRCHFCRRNIDYIDYKDLATLKRYVSDRGKIKPRRTSGNCTQHQSMLAQAIKRSREMALLPYVVKKTRESKGRDRGSRDRRPRNA